ncbi:hypothetical protein BDZ91DRAFT_715735 [Kalaharituber pfeilii]|nr:hypothetical protein BDZ91DRAFT_715735 [Kalaharituber pfeilii]
MERCCPCLPFQPMRAFRNKQAETPETGFGRYSSWNVPKRPRAGIRSAPPLRLCHVWCCLLSARFPRDFPLIHGLNIMRYADLNELMMMNKTVFSAVMLAARPFIAPLSSKLSVYAVAMNSTHLRRLIEHMTYLSVYELRFNRRITTDTPIPCIHIHIPKTAASFKLNFVGYSLPTCFYVNLKHFPVS